MKKKKLERMEGLELDTEIGNQYAITARIIDVGGDAVLETDLWKKRESGDIEKVCRHFTDRDSYWTLFTSPQTFDGRVRYQGEWSQMSLEVVLNRGNIQYIYVNNKTINYSLVTRQEIEHFTGRPNAYDVIDNLFWHEAKTRDRKNREAAGRKAARIEALMDKVEPIAGDQAFWEWMDKNVYTERYIFADTKEKVGKGFRCSCASCGGVYFAEARQRHNHRAVCKKCGAEAVIKTRTKKIERKKYILTAQPAGDDMWVLRHFESTERAGTEPGKCAYRNTIFREQVRIFMDKDMVCSRGLYWGQSLTAADREQKWWDAKNYYGEKVHTKFLFYPGALENTCMPEGLKRILAAGAEAKLEADYNLIVRVYNIEKIGFLEYLIKGSFYKLFNDIVSELFYIRSDISGVPINPDAHDLPGLLKLDAQRVRRLRDMDGGKNALYFLQAEITDGKISQENLLYAEKHKISPKMLKTDRTQMKPNKMLNYLRRQTEKNSMNPAELLKIYRDYLDMAEERGADITDPIICASSRMMEYHDAYLEEKNWASNEKRAAELDKKFTAIKGKYAENMALFAWENKNYVIQAPEGAIDIVTEGQKQHNCVAASDNYFKRMNDGKSYILFLRKKSNPGKPYYTLEVAVKDGGVKILQRYGAYNRTPDVKAVDKALAEWKKAVKQRLAKQAAVKGNMPALMPAI